MENVFFEKPWRKCIPLILIQTALLFGFATPFVQGNRIVSWSILIVLLAIVVQEIKLLVKREGPVLVIKEDSLFIRGVRPGGYKLFQLPCSEEINFADVQTVEIGRIRRMNRLGLKAAPRGEPSRNASSQFFLWITYKREGRLLEIYYPHTAQIANFHAAAKRLIEVMGEKVTLYPPYRS